MKLVTTVDADKQVDVNLSKTPEHVVQKVPEGTVKEERLSALDAPRQTRKEEVCCDLDPLSQQAGWLLGCCCGVLTVW